MSITKRLKDPIGYLIERVKMVGFSTVFGFHFGLYRGIVIDVDDPEQRGRVRVQVPAAGQFDEADVPDDLWALPSMPGVSAGISKVLRGFYTPWSVGDQVWVMYEKGSPTSPVVVGGWAHRKVEVNDFSPERTGVRTKSGHLVRLDDERGTITIARGDGETQEATTVFIEEDKISIATKSGALVYINGAGGEVTLAATDGSLASVGNDSAKLVTKSGAAFELNEKDVSIIAPRNFTVVAGQKIALLGSTDIGPGPYENAVTGQSFSVGYLAHTHLTGPSPGAPTPPPVTAPPAPGAGLSNTVRVSK